MSDGGLGKSVHPLIHVFAHLVISSIIKHQASEINTMMGLPPGGSLLSTKAKQARGRPRRGSKKWPGLASSAEGKAEAKRGEGDRAPRPIQSSSRGFCEGPFIQRGQRRNRPDPGMTGPRPPRPHLAGPSPSSAASSGASHPAAGTGL